MPCCVLCVLCWIRGSRWRWRWGHWRATSQVGAEAALSYEPRAARAYNSHILCSTCVCSVHHHHITLCRFTRNYAPKTCHLSHPYSAGLLCTIRSSVRSPPLSYMHCLGTLSPPASHPPIHTQQTSATKRHATPPMSLQLSGSWGFCSCCVCACGSTGHGVGRPGVAQHQHQEVPLKPAPAAG